MQQAEVGSGREMSEFPFRNQTVSEEKTEGTKLEFSKPTGLGGGDVPGPTGRGHEHKLHF